MTKHKIKPVLLRHQLHYLHDLYEELANMENSSLNNIANTEILQKAIGVVQDYEYLLRHKK